MLGDKLITYIMCLAIHLILYLGIIFRKEHKDLISRRFIHILIVSFLYQFFTLISEIMDGHEKLSVLLYIFNLLTFLSIDFLMIAFTLYLSAILREDAKAPSKLLKLPIISSYARIALVLVLMFTGKLFTLKHGYYQDAELSYLPYAFSAFVVAEELYVVIRKREHFSRRELWVIILYLVFPIFPMIVEFFTELYTLTPVSITLSILLIYILIQEAAIETSKLREQTLKEISDTDRLTGLNNRRAYYDRISNLRAEETVGVLFCDLNRLKYTNDHFGHSAGDELICQFGTMLCDTFRHDWVYRISGDEFIIIIPDATKDVFDCYMQALRYKISTSDDIAAVGASFGAGSRIEHLVAEAENEMYRDKRSFYSSRNISNERSGY